MSAHKDTKSAWNQRFVRILYGILEADAKFGPSPPRPVVLKHNVYTMICDAPKEADEVSATKEADEADEASATKEADEADEASATKEVDEADEAEDMRFALEMAVARKAIADRHDDSNAAPLSVAVDTELTERLRRDRVPPVVVVNENGSLTVRGGGRQKF